MSGPDQVVLFPTLLTVSATVNGQAEINQLTVLPVLATQILTPPPTGVGGGVTDTGTTDPTDGEPDLLEPGSRNGW